MTRRLPCLTLALALVAGCGHSRRGGGDDDDDSGDGDADVDGDGDGDGDADADGDGDADADGDGDADADGDGDADADGDGDADADGLCEERLCCLWTGYSGPIEDLTEFEWRDICQQTADYWGGEGFRCDCPDGGGVGIPADWVESDCVPNRYGYAECGLTVEDVVACDDDIALDMCANGEGSEACAAVYACQD